MRLIAFLVSAGFVGYLAFPLPTVDVEVLGEGASRNFLFYSALLPVLLLLSCSLLESRPFTRVVTAGATVGAAIGIGAQLVKALFVAEPVTFFALGSIFPDTLVDDALWLIGNTVTCALVIYAALTQAEEIEDEPEAD